MNDTTNTWANAWAASQQALMQTLFPVPVLGGANAGDMGAPLEEQFAELRDTWKDSLEKWAALMKQSPHAGALTPEALRALFTPARWSGTGAGAFDAGLRQLIEGPRYGGLFDLDRKLLVLRQLAAQRDKDVAAFQGIMMQAWNVAFERFSTSLASAKEPAPATWRGMAERWLAIANDTLTEIHRSDAFIEAQRKMLRSASDYRLQERQIAEAWCDAFHIPTRTEMDEMQRAVTELRRQLRAVQRGSSPTSAANASTAAPPGKRAAASKSRRSTHS